jgi:hypothetical protein
VATADDGNALRAQVTATNADGKATATTDQTAVVGVPANGTKPSILGAATVAHASRFVSRSLMWR